MEIENCLSWVMDIAGSGPASLYFWFFFLNFHNKHFCEDYEDTNGQDFLPVTVRNVKEIRRLMPQFMLEVRAMARPLIPPGKISLSNSQGTRRKGRMTKQN